MLRKALVSLMEWETDIEVVADLGDGARIVSRAKEARPDVAVLDIDLPGMDGLTAAAALHTAVPECRTVILTSIGRPEDLRRALASHAQGFLLKDSDPAQLGDAIRSVAAGKRVVDPELALTALDAQPSPLTAREIQVLRLASEGCDARQTALQLKLSAGTVSNYLSTVVSKLGARNRLDAVRIAREKGWL